MTLSFIPKLLAMCGVLVLLGPWLIGLMVDYIRQLIGQIPGRCPDRRGRRTMIAFTLEQLNGWIGQFIWPFVRILALVATAPLFAESAVPVKVKVGLSFVLAAAIGPTLDPMPPVAPGSYAGLWMVMQQVLTGIALGFTMRIVFASVQTAGEFIGLQMGLSFASFFDPGTGANTAVLSRMLNVIAMLTFLALDGHLLVLAALVRSFDTLPIAQIQLHQNGWGVVVEWGKTIFVSGLLLALPLICALLTINGHEHPQPRRAAAVGVLGGFSRDPDRGRHRAHRGAAHAGPLESLFESGLSAMSRVVTD